MEKIAPIFLRFSWVALFLWFGSQQLIDPATWVDYLPTWTGYFPIPGEMLVQANGWFELIAALCLAVGIFTRPIVAILSLHLLGIAWEAGGAIGVRDAALAAVGISLFLSGTDQLTLDYRLAKQQPVNHSQEN